MISRRAELSVNLAAVRERVTAAALDCGRDPGELTLVVVTHDEALATHCDQLLQLTTGRLREG